MNLPAPNAEQYLSAWPFPHIVIDNVFEPEELRAVLKEWPAEHFNFTKNEQQKFKCGTPRESQMGQKTVQFMRRMNGQMFVEWLEKLTMIDGLVADHRFAGGGLHEILPQGQLKIHADFNFHPNTNLDRRINVLIYLNENWLPAYGGDLELFDKEIKDSISIAPLFNRMVIFSTTSDAYHGHPDALSCPPDRSRRSLALYYYSNGRPANERTVSHTTLFKSRNNRDRIAAVKDFARLFIPPVAIRLWVLAKNRI